MNWGFVGLLAVVAGLIYIDHITKERDHWQSAALAEGQAHRTTRSVLADVQQQLQAKVSEINVLKTKIKDPPAAKA